jgi:hypothetical protein
LLNKELIIYFKYAKKDMFKIWYYQDKNFKIRPYGDYLTTKLRNPYQYIIETIYRLYGEKDASKFTCSLIPLIYCYVDKFSAFNWVDILSKRLIKFITTGKETKLGKFPIFYMVSYLLDMMCVPHQYSKMGWA